MPGLLLFSEYVCTTMRYMSKWCKPIGGHLETPSLLFQSTGIFAVAGRQLAIANVPQR
jgi:hypothetical protein